MKKNNFIVIAMLLTTVLFTGCSKGKADAEDQGQSKPDADSVVESVILFGKVNAVTGNELEVLIAKDPYADQAPENSANADGSTAAVGMTPATEAGEEVPQAPKMQLEYTGDEKNIIIPAGARITDQTGGETKLDSVKKGSVIMVLMELDSVKEVGIME